MHIISQSELVDKLQSGQPNFYLIDVRDTDEFEEGHIFGSLHIPWETIIERTKGIKLDREMILYCNTGVRANKAAKFLDNAGFKNIFLYKGGMEEWVNH